MLKLTVVLCSLFAVTIAHQVIAPLDHIPEKFKTHEGCYIKEHDKVLKVGESISAKKSCSEYSCGTQFVTILGCGIVAAKPPCVILQDKNNIYPECCPTINCP